MFGKIKSKLANQQVKLQSGHYIVKSKRWSYSFCISPAFGVRVFPVVPVRCLVPAPLLHILVIGVLFRPQLLLLLLIGLPLNGIPHFLVPELTERHRRLVPMGLEDLLFEVVFEVDLVVDLSWLHVHVNAAGQGEARDGVHGLRGWERVYHGRLVRGRLHEVGHVVEGAFGDVEGLKGLLGVVGLGLSWQRVVLLH